MSNETSNNNIDDFLHEEVAVRDYFLRKASAAPDVEAELDALMRREGIRKSHHTLAIGIGAAVAVAASLLLLFFIHTGKRGQLNVPEGAMVAYEAQADEPTGVTLQHGDADPMSVKGNKVVCLPAASHGANTEIRNVLSTPSNATAEVTLSDGTVVWLNAGSKLVYPETFSGKPTREVQLQGEAYFKVSHDTSHPFIVRANAITTQVLGTEFNVRAYMQANTHVTLLQGSVLVSTSSASRRIVPGEDAMFLQGRLKVHAVDTEAYTAWRQNEFYFDNESLLTIAKEIGKWYNVSVIFQNPDKMRTRLFFAAPRDGSIEEIIEVLNSFNKAKFSYHEGQMVIE